MPALLPSPVEVLDDERLNEAGVRVLLKRDDLIHPEIPGNKWRKLKYNLEAAKAMGAARLLTFGGAYSNHVRAVAAAGALFGFETYDDASAEARRVMDKGISRQAWALAFRTLEVDRVVRSVDRRIVEVHPEMSFVALAGRSVRAELIFCDVYWPGFRELDLLRALRTYARRRASLR